MRRLYPLTLLAVLFLLTGCGPREKVVEPTNVPPPPKGPPVGVQGPGGNQGKQPAKSAGPIEP